MRCKEFVFLQSSGQIPTLGWWRRSSTLAHVWVCRHCRRFRHNDEQITSYVAQLNTYWDVMDQSVK